MIAEIILIEADRTVQFETNEPIGAPDTIICTNGMFYQLVNCGFRPIGGGAFIWSLVYKPATYMHVEIPKNAQIFKRE